MHRNARTKAAEARDPIKGAIVKYLSTHGAAKFLDLFFGILEETGLKDNDEGRLRVHNKADELARRGTIQRSAGKYGPA